MTPQTVNAYYHPTLNEIVFPAAILQPPFFDFAADDAVNYGAIGAVIGHEISHGFDDQGRRSDGDGNLRDWWSATDARAFEERSDRLVDQYSGYSPLQGMTINGRLTLGENIGDLSGLAVAYEAYRRSLGGREAPVIGGLTGDQRFFLGWAQIWRTLYREEALRQRLDRMAGERFGDLTVEMADDFAYNDPVDGCLFIRFMEPGEYRVIMYGLAPDDSENRRVLAVLRYLES